VLAAFGIDRGPHHEDGPRPAAYAPTRVTDADVPRPTVDAHAAMVALLADRAG
jgi:hypothetical protein